MKKLLAFMAAINIVAIPTSSIVSCTTQDKHDFTKIYLSNYTESFFEKLYYFNLNDTEPAKNTDLLKKSILRALETWDNRIIFDEFDKELNINFYDKDGNSIDETAAKDVFYYKLSATSESKYFEGNTQIVSTNFENINVIEKTYTDDKGQPVENRENLSDVFKSMKFNDLTVSGITYTYSNYDGEKLLSDLGSLNSTFGKDVVYFNDYQVSVKMNDGNAIITAKDSSDRYIGTCQIKYKNK